MAWRRACRVACAEPAIYHATQRADANNRLVRLKRRRNNNVVVVAMANKTARATWVPLAHGQEFNPGNTAA